MSTIPDHDGRSVAQMDNAFSGSDDAAPEMLHVGDEVTMIVTGRVSAIAYKEDKFDRMRRVQSIKVSHSMPANEDSIRQINAEVKRREDEENGQASLDAEIDGEIDGEGGTDG